MRVELAEAIGEEAIDLVDLERAPPRLRYGIATEGRLLVGTRERARGFEVRAMRDFFDFRPLEDRYFEKMEERLE